MSRITIKSGFGRGGRILRWDGAQWRAVATIAENTWEGDGDDTQTVELVFSETYAIGVYHTDGHTQVWHWELRGFTPRELSAPAPVCGWRTEDMGGRATKLSRVETTGEWLLATAGRDFLSDSEVIDGSVHHPSVAGLRLARLPYEWGDQAAEHWAVYQGPRLVSQASGCGDWTPEPVVTDSGWEFESAADRQHADGCAQLRAIKAMFDRGEDSPWAEVGRHLAACYKRRLNPLPTLRREHGGEWKFYAGAHPVSDTGIAWQGDGWTVIHTPA